MRSFDLILLRSMNLWVYFYVVQRDNRFTVSPKSTHTGYRDILQTSLSARSTNAYDLVKIPAARSLFSANQVSLVI